MSRLNASLAHWRKVSRQENVGLLRDKVIGPPRRRPDAIGDRLGPQPLALVKVGIGPDVHETEGGTGDAVHRGEQG